MVADVILANAHPILSSMTPRYHWVPPKNKTMLTVYPFADWTREIAVEMNVAYVDHLNSSITLLEKVGYKKGVGLFAPNDRTHTNAKGAVELAETFVAAGKCKTGRCGKVHPVMKSFNKLLSRKGEKIKKSCKKGDNSDSEDDDSDDDDYRDD